MGFSLKKSIVAYAMVSVLSATLIAVPADAAPPPTPSVATVAAALGSSGADSGYATNWSSSNSSPVTADSNGMSISLPEKASGQILLSKNGVSLGVGIPYSSSAGNAQNIGDATTVYSGGAPDVAVAAQADTTGAREAVVITGPSAPTTYSFPLALPAGASLVPDSSGDGGYTIQSTASSGADVQYGTVAAPWAKDANGNPVATSYSVQGNDLVQTVDFTSSTAFPVVADPSITFGWSVYLNVHYSDVKYLHSVWAGLVATFGLTVAGYYACIGLALTTGIGGLLCALAFTAYGAGMAGIINYAYNRHEGFQIAFTYPPLPFIDGFAYGNF